MSSAVRVGDSTPLAPHTGSRRKHTNHTPAPGDYEVGSKHNVKYKTSPAITFGGNLCKIDRDKTGLRAEALRKAEDPGPDNYSGVTEKLREVKPRAPTFKFGSSERTHSSKMYMHRADTTGDVSDPNRAAAGRGVPGPGAYGAMENSLAAIKKAAPKFSFGLKVELSETSLTSTKNIGPGKYQSPSSIGRQLISNRPTSPGFSMGSCSREKMGSVLQPGFSPTIQRPGPGPSKYESPSGVGKQPESKHRSANMYSFGSEGRLKPERSKGVPGPGNYDADSMLGLQSNSKKKSFGGFKFGTSQRPDTSTMSNMVIID